jgi:uncharacterized protein (TIGR02646 family)
MIRVRKPEQAPLVLRERSAALTAELCSKVDAGEPPSFDRGVYGAAEVKQALSAAQHDKCCFCESKLQHAQFGDVEHFRPKASAQQSPDAASTMGYYWLAYAWENLYLSCEVCNRRHKRGLFPLLNPDRRVTSHHSSAELVAEQPMFIDPGREDPMVFIEFRRELAAPVDGNPRGAATIEALQLNRDALWERRRERRELLFICVTLLVKAIRIELPANDREDAIRILEAVITAAAEHGEYSSMTRSLLRHVAPWRQDWAPPAASLFDVLRTDAAGGRVFQLPR